MSVEDDIYQTLAPLFDSRVERDVARSEIARPYATFQQVGGSPYDFLEGAIPSLDNGRFQVNVWADDRDSAAALGRAARQALVEDDELRATTLTGMVAIYEPDTGLFGTRQDFSVNFVP